MKITSTKKVTIVEEKILSIVCNRCSSHLKNSGGGYQGLVEVKIESGYGSIFGDGVTQQFSLCELCVNDLFNTFQIPPEKGMHFK